MIESTLTDGRVHLTMLGFVPRLLLDLAEKIEASGAMATSKETLSQGPLVRSGEGQSDPLVRWADEMANDEQVAKLAASLAANDDRATALLREWAATQTVESILATDLDEDDALALGTWATRQYQALRVRELSLAGTDINVGSSCGVNQFLAELVGDDGTDPSAVEMGMPTALFAAFSSAMIDPAIG